MASVALLVGGALVNALAFSGSNYLFSKIGNSSATAERKRHDTAIEQLQTAQAEWSRKRTKRLDWINDELRRQGHATRTFQDADAAIREYNNYTTDKLSYEDGRKPILSDFYVPSNDQKDREIAFVALGLGATALVAYSLV